LPDSALFSYLRLLRPQTYTSRGFRTDFGRYDINDPA